MKKKLTAVFLTLCMVLGMLPMSVLAGWKLDGAGEDVTFQDVDGNSYYKLVEIDNNKYYVLASVTEDHTKPIVLYNDLGQTASGKTLTWVEDAGKFAVTITQGEGTTLTVEDADGNAVATNSEVAKGTVLTVTVEATEGYEDPKVTVNDVEKELTDGSCTVTVNEATTIVSSASKVVSADVTGDTASVEAEPDQTGKVEVSVTVTTEQVNTMVENASNGSVTVEVTSAAATTTEVAVTLPKTLLDEVKKATNTVAQVEVRTEVATVSLPVSAFTTTVNVTFTASKETSAPAASTLGSVKLELKLDSSAVTNFNSPVAVDVTPSTEPTSAQLQSHGVAYKHGNIWERVNSFYDRTKNAFTFHTRHFSEFAIMDASVSQPTSITAQTTGEYDLDIEANETLYALIDAKSGKAYIASGATADTPADTLRKASVGAPVADTENVYVVVGGVNYTEVKGVKMVAPANGQASIMAVLKAE